MTVTAMAAGKGIFRIYNKGQYAQTVVIDCEEGGSMLEDIVSPILPKIVKGCSAKKIALKARRCNHLEFCAGVPDKFVLRNTGHADIIIKDDRMYAEK